MVYIKICILYKTITNYYYKMRFCYDKNTKKLTSDKKNNRKLLPIGSILVISQKE